MHVELARAIDMFETPAVQLGSTVGGFTPGVERCISELLGQPDRSVTDLEIALPADEIEDSLGDRMAVTLRRYCDERIRRNSSERAATIRGGFRSFLIGGPVTLIGLTITVVATKIGDIDDALRAVVDILGWVLAWVGLWYPFDQILFTPLDGARENRVLTVLRDAEIRIVPLH